jgi:LysR family nitrogen assimilation transcriptional regulator
LFLPILGERVEPHAATRAAPLVAKWALEQRQETEIELKQLRYFVGIVDSGSVSRAASDMHIAQSALSQHVAVLEREFNTPLLLRSARGVAPTEAGKQLYRHAQLMLQQAEQARASVSNCTSEPSGPVSFGMPLSLAGSLAYPIFEAVWQHHPLVRLQMHEGVSGSILEWIRTGRLSIGLAFDDENLDGLDAIPVMEERLFLVVSTRSPLAKRKVVSLAEVQQLPLIMPLPGQGLRPGLERAMVREGMVLSHVVAEANCVHLLKRAAMAGVAHTVLGWQSFADEVAAGTLAGLQIVRPSVLQTTALCTAAAAWTQTASRVRACIVDGLRHAISRSRWRGVRFLGEGEPAASTPPVAKPVVLRLAAKPRRQTADAE